MGTWGLGVERVHTLLYGKPVMFLTSFTQTVIICKFSVKEKEEKEKEEESPES